MCVVSMIMDHYSDKWGKFRPYFSPFQNPEPWPPTQPATQPYVSPIKQEEVDELRRLLGRARDYDRRNNEPDCELDEKKQTLKRVAEALGINLEDVLK